MEGANESTELPMAAPYEAAFNYRAINACMSPSSLPEELVAASGGRDLAGSDVLSLSNLEPSTPTELNDTEVEKRHFLAGEKRQC